MVLTAGLLLTGLLVFHRRTAFRGRGVTDYESARSGHHREPLQVVPDQPARAGESGGSSLKRRLRSFRDWARGDETFWALDDVSFSVRPGEWWA